MVFVRCLPSNAEASAGRPVKEGGTAETAEIWEWKPEGSSIHLGCPVNYPGWTWADVPSNVVASASKILRGKPSGWQVNNYRARDKAVVLLRDRRRHCRIYLALPDKWVWINQPKGFPYINDTLADLFASPCELEDPVKLGVYVGYVSALFKGPFRIALTSGFLESMEQKVEKPSGKLEPMLNDFLQGREKDPEALRSLCADPMLQLQGDSFEIQCNLMTGHGAVERWTLKGKLGKAVTLTDIAVAEIRRDGTFFCPEVPRD